MPNWCSNHLTLRHDDAAIRARVCSAFIAGALLNEFIPCPERLRNTQAVYYPDGHELRAAQDQLEADNIRDYGFKNWYDWQVAHWGTKWDIGSDDCLPEDYDDGRVVMQFDSAWSPPIEAYERLQDLGFGVEAYYYEPGMAFCGSWIDGDDYHIDILGNSVQAAGVIPETIDDMFDIVNSMAMWEDEEELG